MTAKNGSIPSRNLDSIEKQKRRIDLKEQRDRQTDGQTDRQTESTTKINRLLVLLRQILDPFVMAFLSSVLHVHM